MKHESCNALAVPSVLDNLSWKTHLKLRAAPYSDSSSPGLFGPYVGPIFWTVLRPGLPGSQSFRISRPEPGTANSPLLLWYQY
ncbi:hypothetical protein GDO81_008672 [Engystomops pustulosus]|uniref:Uncharacterized protein n=1 Tax=Engystomops pustulosus TaxID=76066 RepID=A0AAV7CIG3_ENGPU|nr:hypothetical protein GDO81_008672 [Engystomops pustulosus]